MPYSLKMYLPQNRVGVHGLLSWVPWLSHIWYGVHPGTCIDKVFLMHFWNVPVNVKLCVCILSIFEIFQKLVTFQKHFRNVTITVCFLHYLQCVLISNGWISIIGFLLRFNVTMLTGSTKTIQFTFENCFQVSLAPNKIK